MFCPQAFAVRIVECGGLRATDVFVFTVLVRPTCMYAFVVNSLVHVTICSSNSLVYLVDLATV